MLITVREKVATKTWRMQQIDSHSPPVVESVVPGSPSPLLSKRQSSAVTEMGEETGSGGCARWCKQLSAMLMKHLKWRMRHPIQTFFEICVPLFIILIISLIRLGVPKDSSAQSLHADQVTTLLDTRNATIAATPTTSDPAEWSTFYKKRQGMPFVVNKTLEWNFRIGVVAAENLRVNGRRLYEDFRDQLVSDYPELDSLAVQYIKRFADNAAVDDYCEDDHYIEDVQVRTKET